MPTMKQAYQTQISQGKLCVDKAQLTAVNALQALLNQLKTNQLKTIQSDQSFFSKVFGHFHQKEHLKGIYFYGKVGRGKTMLMDLFYDYLPIKKKKRIHFHRFMEEIHQQLNQLSKAQPGIDNPLTHIASSWAEKVKVLCFDEFFVSDIGDAMLLSGLLKAFFNQGIILIATSNCKPEMLYRNGLQRERFLPTINLINSYCEIISVDGDTDHRLEGHDTKKNSPLKSAGYQNFVFPCAQYPHFLLERFERLTQPAIKKQQAGELLVNNRAIAYLAKGEDNNGQQQKVIWFDFFALCSGPRSQRDYIQIANSFTTVLLSNVPQFSGELIPAVFSGVEDSYQRSGVLMGNLQHLDDEARRFIALVDEFYDRNVELIISAQVDITALYQGQQLSFEFERCQSRLFEMQSMAYHLS